METTRSTDGSVCDAVLYVALELSKREWMLGVTTGVGRARWRGWWRQRGAGSG